MLKNLNKINDLLDQIIEFNLNKDLNEKKEIETGESWNVYYLKLLKKIINEE